MMLNCDGFAMSSLNLIQQAITKVDLLRGKFCDLRPDSNLIQN